MVPIRQGAEVTQPRPLGRFTACHRPRVREGIEGGAEVWDAAIARARGCRASLSIYKQLGQPLCKWRVGARELNGKKPSPAREENEKVASRFLRPESLKVFSRFRRSENDKDGLRVQAPKGLRFRGSKTSRLHQGSKTSRMGQGVFK